MSPLPPPHTHLYVSIFRISNEMHFSLQKNEKIRQLSTLSRIARARGLYSFVVVHRRPTYVHYFRWNDESDISSENEDMQCNKLPHHACIDAENNNNAMLCDGKKKRRVCLLL